MGVVITETTLGRDTGQVLDGRESAPAGPDQQTEVGAAKLREKK
jgi:hypothetical protein